VVDPRLSPDGTRAAFIVDGAFFACDLATLEIIELASPEGEHDFWGLADFVSAEELDRHRGYWWLEDSRRLLVQHTDESDVEIRWISDPANPEKEPVQHRYPAAGTANPSVRLTILDLDGTRTDVEWDYTHFPYLRPAWAELCREDRLVGVDITGQCDNPALSGDEESMTYLNALARSTAIIAAATLKVNRPAAITCGKPSGNSSQFVDCASGFHTRYAKYYHRHVRISSKDPLYHLVRDQGVPLFKENGQEHLDDDKVDVWVARFPVKSPDGAKLRDHERALQQLERYRQIMRTWCGTKGHNQSATVYVRDEEWPEVGQWLWDHFDEVTGLSFLNYDGGAYRLAPYVEITEEEYLKSSAEMPRVRFDLLHRYETGDMGDGAREAACVGGACDI
jgi:hypothetical protein